MYASRKESLVSNNPSAVSGFSLCIIVHCKSDPFAPVVGCGKGRDRDRGQSIYGAHNAYSRIGWHG